MGDFNARTTNQRASMFCCKEDRNPIWLIEEENPQWLRCSEDDKVSNHFGEEWLTLCGAFNLIIYNGLDRWKGSRNFTCNTYNGASVIDCVIFSQSLIENIDEVKIGEHIWDLKLDHNPIYIKLSWLEERKHGRKNQCSQQSLSMGNFFSNTRKLYYIQDNAIEINSKGKIWFLEIQQS